MVPERKYCQLPVLAAKMQFWGSPNLVAQLLTFLDISSTLALVNVLPLARDLLQRKSIWGNMISRSIFFSSQEQEGEEEEEREKRWERTEEMNKFEVAQLVEILKMVNDPESLLLQELLDTICERFQNPSNDYFNMEMSCSRHPDHHDVDQEGFLLLELAEGMMGTSLQEIRTMHFDNLEENSDEAFELALSARLARQTEQLDRVGLLEAVILSNQGLNATILQKTLDWNIQIISIGDSSE